MSYLEQDVFQQGSSEHGSTLFDLYARMERQNVEFFDLVMSIDGKNDTHAESTEKQKQIEHSSERKIDTVKEALFYILINDPLEATFKIRLTQAHDILTKDRKIRRLIYAGYYNLPHTADILAPLPLAEYAPNQEPLIDNAIRKDHDVSYDIGNKLYTAISTTYEDITRLDTLMFLSSCTIGDRSGAWLQDGSE